MYLTQFTILDQTHSFHEPSLKWSSPRKDKYLDKLGHQWQESKLMCDTPSTPSPCQYGPLKQRMLYRLRHHTYGLPACTIWVGFRIDYYMASSTVIMGNLTSRVMLSLYHEYFYDIVSTVFLLFFHTVDIEDCRLCHWQFWGIPLSQVWKKK